MKPYNIIIFKQMRPSKINVNKRFQKLETLGEGTYGVVYKCVDTLNSGLVAMKKIKMEDREEGIPSTTMREISILRELQPHPNIVDLRDVIYHPMERKLHLIFEFVEMDLKKYLTKHMMTPTTIKYIMNQIVTGLDYCHSKRIIHRDIKPQNVLINKDLTVKIADFGLSRTFGLPMRTLTHQIQTLWYRAPEVLLGGQYSLGVDTWAVGCIFAELYEGKTLFQGDSEIDQIFKIFQFHGTPNEETNAYLTKLPQFKPSFPKFKPASLPEIVPNMCGDKDALDLFLELIALDSIERISMKGALKHRYFKGYKGNEQEQ